MANNVDPVIVVKLAEFRQRLWKVRLIRAVCAGVIALFALATILVILDWLFVMSDELRWLLAVLLYGCTAAVFWKFAFSFFVRLDDRDLARCIEDLQPELRDRLLAAVELGESPGAQTDSSVFRQCLQKEVAAQLRDLDMKSLLPESLVHSWFRMALLLVAISAALLLLPRTPFRLLAARAFSPGANLARFSQTEVKLISPVPPEAIVARGDDVPIVASLSGKPARHAAIEFRNFKGGWKRLNMTLLKPGQFSAILPALDEPIEFRLVAGDAITRSISPPADASTACRPLRKNLSLPPIRPARSGQGLR